MISCSSPWTCAFPPVREGSSTEFNQRRHQHPIAPDHQLHPCVFLLIAIVLTSADRDTPQRVLGLHPFQIRKNVGGKWHTFGPDISIWRHGYSDVAASHPSVKAHTLLVMVQKLECGGDAVSEMEFPDITDVKFGRIAGQGARARTQPQAPSFRTHLLQRDLRERCNRPC